MLTTNQIIAKYGKPDDDGSDYLVSLDLPYTMVLAWDTKTAITRIRCHKLIKNNLGSVFFDILKHYGLPEIKRLGLNLFV